MKVNIICNKECPFSETQESCRKLFEEKCNYRFPAANTCSHCPTDVADKCELLSDCCDTFRQAKENITR